MPHPAPDFDLLIAAGDIHDPLSEGVRWLAERANGRPVIYVPGNHEWYAHRQRFTIDEETKRVSALAEELGIHLLQDADVEIGGVRFLGSTLWTDCQIFGGGTLYMRHAKRWMNDHRVIFPTEIGMPLDPSEALEWHLQSKAWLDDRLKSKLDGTTVVVTHHLPHPRSIHPRFADDPLTPAFCGDLSELVEVLERVCAKVGYPASIRVNQGSEFISRELDLWAYMKGVTLDLSRPGKPTDNAFIETFNGKFRAECLNAHWFMSLDDAVRKCEAWRRDYNEVRPHSAIGNKPPISLLSASVAHGPP